MNVTAVLTILGILVGLWDMFHQLLHPRGSGPLSSLAFSAVWRVARASRHRLGFALGPFTMVAVVLLWVLLQALGWAMIHLPHVPDGFLSADGVEPGNYASFVEALYISLVTLATLGFGDVVAVDPTLRLVTPLQGLTGFALLTAALTWFMQIYPPLLRRRSAALTLKALEESDYGAKLGTMRNQLGPTLSLRFVSGRGLDEIFATYSDDHPSPRWPLSRLTGACAINQRRHPPGRKNRPR